MKTTARIEGIMEYLREHESEIEWARFKSTKSFHGNWVDVELADGYARVIPIKSYKTIIGYVDLDDETVYEYGKYTFTTSKQFTCMYNQYWRSYKRELVDVETDFYKMNWGCVV